MVLVAVMASRKARMGATASHHERKDADNNGVSNDVDGGGGDLSGLLGAVLVHYVERALGKVGVQKVIEQVGPEAVLQLVEHWEEWVEFEVVLSVAIRVAELCHEPDIGRRAGEEMYRVLVERGLLRLPAKESLVDLF